jgi:F420-0:gamma-glutamyl ligase
MIISGIKTRIFQTNDEILPFILEHIQQIEEKSVLLITSKIIALSEGRLVKINNESEKEKIIREESEYAFRHPYGWLSIVDGLMTGSAGLDASNIEGDLYSLLPVDCFESAAKIRAELMKKFSLQDFGVVISDSRLMPLRKGALGAAFGYAGIKPLRDYTGSKDLFGRNFVRQKANIPDALASAAVLEMGEGAEQKPLAIITGASIEFTNEAPEKKTLQVPAEDDIYYYFFRSYPH